MKTASVKKTSKKLITIPSENKFRAYSNHTGILSTNYDFKMMFGSIESATDSEITILELGSVTLSPHHAKAFCKNLTLVIEKFEASFGDIKLDNPT
jgi:hypothetical protein